VFNEHKITLIQLSFFNKYTIIKKFCEENGHFVNFDRVKKQGGKNEN